LSDLYERVKDARYIGELQDIWREIDRRKAMGP
jgi:hypothetical protein